MPKFQQLPIVIHLKIYSFFKRKELLGGINLVDKNTEIISKYDLIKKNQILAEIGPDLVLLCKKKETLTQTFDRNILLLTIIKNKVIGLLTNKSLISLSEEEQKILPCFHAHCILPSGEFLKIFLIRIY
jgi:hypothetical protein